MGFTDWVRKNVLLEKDVREASPGNYDPDVELSATQGGSAYFRRLSNNPDRDLQPLIHERTLEIAFYLYDSNPIAKRALEITRDYILGDGISVLSTAAAPAQKKKMNEIIDLFWNDVINHMDMRLYESILELGLWGEVIWTVTINPVNGHVRLGTIDPSLIKEVVCDPVNSERVIELVLADDTEKKANRYKVIEVDEDPNNTTFGRMTGAPDKSKYSGSCFFWRINKVSKSRHGRSDLLCNIDWIDSYDQILFNEVDRSLLMKSFIWDVTLTGADSTKIAEYQKSNPVPKPGSVRFHNESVKWEAVTPDLKPQDAQSGADLLLSYMSAGLGLPKTWLSGTMDVNKAVSRELTEPAFKRLMARQRFVRHMLKELMTFVLDQAELKGRIPKRENQNGVTPETWSFQVNAPEILARDLQATSQTFQQSMAALTGALSQKLIDKTTAQKIVALLAGQYGIDMDFDEMVKAIEKEEKAEIASGIPPRGLPPASPSDSSGGIPVDPNKPPKPIPSGKGNGKFPAAQRPSLDKIYANTKEVSIFAIPQDDLSDFFSNSILVEDVPSGLVSLWMNQEGTLYRAKDHSEYASAVYESYGRSLNAIEQESYYESLMEAGNAGSRDAFIEAGLAQLTVAGHNGPAPRMDLVSSVTLSEQQLDVMLQMVGNGSSYFRWEVDSEIGEGLFELYNYLEHLQGKHSQKTHGRRSAGNLDVADFWDVVSMNDADLSFQEPGDDTPAETAKGAVDLDGSIMEVSNKDMISGKHSLMVELSLNHWGLEGSISDAGMLVIQNVDIPKMMQQRTVKSIYDEGKKTYGNVDFTYLITSPTKVREGYNWKDYQLSWLGLDESSREFDAGEFNLQEHLQGKHSQKTHGRRKVGDALRVPNPKLAQFSASEISKQLPESTNVEDLLAYGDSAWLSPNGGLTTVFDHETTARDAYTKLGSTWNVLDGDANNKLLGRPYSEAFIAAGMVRMRNTKSSVAVEIGSSPTREQMYILSVPVRKRLSFDWEVHVPGEPTSDGAGWPGFKDAVKDRYPSQDIFMSMSPEETNYYELLEGTTLPNLEEEPGKDIDAPNSSEDQ